MSNQDLHNLYEFDNDIVENSFNSNTLTPWRFAFEKIENGDKVLEIGCATGYWGKYTKAKKPNTEIVGLDYLAYHIEKTRELSCYHDLIQYNLNELDNTLDQYQHYFDKIIILDVLEHLYNPAMVLEWCKNLLKPDGYIIISMPNVGHKTIIHQLLLSQFNYTETGLLDRTHIRFFTINSFIELLNNSQLEICELDRTVNAMSEYKEFIPARIYRFIDKLPENNTIQFLCLLKLNENPTEINSKYYIQAEIPKEKRYLNIFKKFYQSIFDVRNKDINGQKYKMITILGIKFQFLKKQKNN